MEIASDGQDIRDTFLHLSQGPVDELYPTGAVSGADAVLRDQQIPMEFSLTFLSTLARASR